MAFVLGTRGLLSVVLPLRTGVENLAIWKCTALYYYVDHVQEVYDIDSGWPAGVTW